jgi:aspartyl-tRNA(Asn)/glutamyl-tRNA(Gln) amidotransferase subunit A
MDPCGLGVIELARRVAAGEVPAKQVVAAHLERIRALQGRLNAFITVDGDRALADAAELDRRLQRGQPPGPLAGVPLAVKDNLTTRGLRTTCGSRLLRDWVPPHDATAVARLRRAGAVVLGKTNLDEFAMGSSNEHSAFGPCRNPWHPERVPGGSSGGSAAAVAAGQAAAALGTDTGGSIRQPAALCGLVGLKPTYGRVSRHGLVAFASSLDQAGPLTRTVRDCALLMDLLAGPDPLDSTSLRVESGGGSHLAACERGVGGLRVGVLEPAPGLDAAAGLDPQVAQAVDRALAQLERLGARLVTVRLPSLDLALSAYVIIAAAEASSNLARFDGLRYGHRAGDGTLEHGPVGALETTRGQLGPEVKRRIMLGTFALSAGYHEAYYGRAQQVRRRICEEFEQAFCGCDLLAGPTSPVPAFGLGQRLEDPLQMYLADVFTLPANLAGLPALSLPCGFSGDGLPLGLQLTGPPLSEPTLLAAAAAYEGASEWSRRRPRVEATA